MEVIWSMGEMILWWLGIIVGLVVIGTLFYWVVEDSNLDDETENKKLYDFVERKLGKNFLKVFKMFI